jgi:peptidyl-prolyl cis-trans isomerase A (cyclophilin A)
MKKFRKFNREKTSAQMGLRLIIAICVLALVGCDDHPSGGTRRVIVTIETGEGQVDIELYGDKAPKTVNAFLSNIDRNIYENTSFYRVLNDENQPSDAFKAAILQGGIWRTNRKKINPPQIPHENTQITGIKHLRGTISLARESPGSATTEFFICLDDEPGLDFGGANNPDGQGYAAFGKVINGMDAVRKIFRKPENDQYFDPPVPIFTISRK